jgi:hypothetical protein
MDLTMLETEPTPIAPARTSDDWEAKVEAAQGTEQAKAVDDLIKQNAIDSQPTPLVLPTGAPHFKRSTRWVELPPDIAEGCKFEMVTSYPASLREDMTSGDPERATPALLSVCLQHNGWYGEDGRELPPMNTLEFWGAPNLTDEIGATVVALVLTEPREHPFTARQKRGR